MRRAKAFMVLGTGSNVGKSVITAGLCRILADAGWRVAPFKAQNMSNNSFVTPEGEEMGRAQAVQARAARVEPHSDMNPVLLKPSADDLSQVVVQGKVFGHLRARQYFARRKDILTAVRESYERLASSYEVIVIEGAGSCAELNLKKDDFVNFWMARLADARCVLVGDIDRGGIFASLLGTLALLTKEERSRIDGLIVNKFRGDPSLFEEGVRLLEERSGKRVWGVVPYDPELWLESEDAVCLESAEKILAAEVREQGVLDIAVILLPHISNFTDFEVLRQEVGLRLRFLKRPEELGYPDLLILPGTKATIADLGDLRRKGWEPQIREYYRRGGKILGICGGYQMLGEWIVDPSGVESAAGRAQGLGFFKMTTEFFPEKILRQMSLKAEAYFAGQPVCGQVEGYEIHMGRTLFEASYAGFPGDGALHPSGRVAGTYLHGLFGSKDFRVSFLTSLRQSSPFSGSRGSIRRRASLQAASQDLALLQEENFSRLAHHLRRHLALRFLETSLGVNLHSSVRDYA